MNICHQILENAERRGDHPALVQMRARPAGKAAATTGDTATSNAAASNAPVHATQTSNEILVSYTDLAARVRAMADDLCARGVRPGQRIGMIAPQGTAFIETALGILAAGACMVPIADDHPPATIEDLARRAHLHALARIEATDDGRATITEWQQGDASRFAHESEFAATGPAYLRFTSGTTSERKGVVIGHARIAERLAAANEGLAITEDDRVLWLLPMAHHFVVSILLYLQRGATILLPASSLAPAVLELAETHKATVLYASPHHMKLLGKDTGERRLDDLRLAVSTAEGLRAPIAEAFAARFGRPVVQALGIMEVGLPVMNKASATAKPEALGRPQPAYEVWLRAEDGSAATGESPDHAGELCLRGPGMLDAYLDPWIPAAELLHPDGFRTGDQAWRDADGDLHLLGRRAARINMAGMKFFCEEVEAVLDTHPAIERSRVFATEHPHLGEIPSAEIVLAAGVAEAPNARELAGFCRERLAAYMVPRRFDVVDALPLTPTGKLSRT